MWTKTLNTVHAQTRIKPRGIAPDALSGGLDNWTSLCNHTHKQARWDSVSLCECVRVCVRACGPQSVLRTAE